MIGTWTGYAESDGKAWNWQWSTDIGKIRQAGQRSHVSDSNSVANKLYF